MSPEHMWLPTDRGMTPLFIAGGGVTMGPGYGGMIGLGYAGPHDIFGGGVSG